MASGQSRGRPERVPGSESARTRRSIPHIGYMPGPVNPELDGVKKALWVDASRLRGRYETCSGTGRTAWRRVPSPGRLSTLEVASERGDPFCETFEAAAGRRARASATVVGDVDHDRFDSRDHLHRARVASAYLEAFASASATR